MITSYRLEHGAPVRAETGLDALLQDGWLDLETPSAEECSQVHEKLGIPLVHLQAALDHNERPRLEYGAETLLVVMRAPVEGGAGLNETFRTSPVAVILRDGLIITVCPEKRLVVDLLGTTAPDPKARPVVTLLLSLLMRISTSFIRHLQQLDELLQDIERALQISTQNQELFRMVHTEKALIYFVTALKGNQSVLEKFRSGIRTIQKEERHLLEYAIIETKQAVDMAEIYSQILGSLGNAFGTVVSNNLNKVVKMLTSLTIVFTIPAIIGALFGMNVPLPWQDHPYAFAVLFFLCFGISFLVYYILKKKDWM